MTNWKKYKLDEIAEITSSKRIFLADYVSEGIPFYRSKEVIEKANGEKISSELFIDNHKYFEIKKRFGSPVDGDLLISAVGERAGIPYCVKSDGDFYFKDGNLIWFRKFTKEVNSKYLYYFFRTDLGQSVLQSTMIGSAQRALTIIGLKNLEINFPGLPTQTRIASILSSLDDKIELNRRMNQTLEQIAATLFKKYFVDDIDPDNLPEGWRWGKLGEISMNVRRGVQPNQIDSNTIYLGLEHLPRKSLAIYDFGTSLGLESNKFRFSENSILFGKLRPYFHKVIITPFAGVCSTDILVIEPSSHDYLSFCLFHFFSEEIIDYSNQFSDGTRMPRVNWESLSKFEVVIPPIELASKFNEKVWSLIEKIKSGIKENKKLEQIRDTLLPKLMSGEIDITAIKQNQPLHEEIFS